ncbi:DUSAM domain-containing protein [Corallococcus terminator]
MPDQRTWDEIWELNQRVTDQGQPFVLTDDLRQLLRVTASDVAIAPAEVEQALASDASAAALLKEVAKRIRVGSRRLSQAMSDVDQRKEAGDMDGARQVMQDLLEIEVVPHYRDIAQTYLDALDDP